MGGFDAVRLRGTLEDAASSNAKLEEHCKGLSAAMTAHLKEEVDKFRVTLEAEKGARTESKR